jgi:hypothetical protein
MFELVEALNDGAASELLAPLLIQILLAETLQL